jgi:pyrroline-5-carboxylate reductase
MIANQQIAFIGGGHLTEMILDNLAVKHVIPAEQLIVSDPIQDRIQHLKKKFDIRITSNNVDAIKNSDLILICVRPEVVGAVLSDLQASILSSNQIVISVAAGIPLSKYNCLGEQQPLVRALPNPPSQVGQAISPLAFSPSITSEQRQLVKELFTALGQVVEVDESYINAITSLSSPVATYLFFQSLIEAGVHCGLPYSVSMQVAAQTIIGSMSVWRARNVSPSQLITEASTPGGVSVECLNTLEGYSFEDAIIEAIAKGADRANEMGKDF